MKNIFLFFISFLFFSALSCAQTQNQQAQTINIDGYQPATSNISNPNLTNVIPRANTTSATAPSNSTIQSSTILSCTPGEFTQTVPSQGVMRTRKLDILGLVGDKCHIIITTFYPNNPKSQNNPSNIVAECYLSKQTLNDMHAMEHNLLQVMASGKDPKASIPREAMFKMLVEMQKECTMSIDGKKINLPSIPMMQ